MKIFSRRSETEDETRPLPADGGARRAGREPSSADGAPSRSPRRRDTGAEDPVGTFAPGRPDATPPDAETPAYLRLGRYAWATLGIIGVLFVLGTVVGNLVLLVVPLILALFPAALLMPVASGLKRIGVPAALAAILTIVVTLGIVAGVIALLAPIVANEAPELVDSLNEGVSTFEAWLSDDPLGLGFDFDGFEDVVETAREQIGQMDIDEAGLAGGAVTAVTALFEGVTTLLLLLVAVFFYLKDDGKLARGTIRTLPERWRADATALGDRFWVTTGRYFRGQLLVALADAVFIGLGLWVLDIPLALPLAVLVFFGGLFPIVGAVLTGLVAVFVALADAGLVRALLVAGLVLAVQQAESNLLEPLILARVIRLHPLVVIVSITAGGVLLGVLGAFLAVPVAASIARAIDYARGEEAEELGEARRDPEELVDDGAD